MRGIIATLAILILGSCGGGGGRVSGEISEACLSAGRSAANPQLCGCVQAAANSTLTRSEQRKAARFFTEPDEAQDALRADDAASERFWARYKAFSRTAEALCRV